MHLPHLSSFRKQPLLFITACIAQRRPILASESAHETLKSVWQRSAPIDEWYVGRYLLMPDHVHFFARPGLEAKPLPTWIKSWKSISSRRLIAAHQIPAPIWQSDYFDHFVRSLASYEEKWAYVLNNPVRAGLSADSKDWPYQGVLHELEFE